MEPLPPRSLVVLLVLSYLTASEGQSIPKCKDNPCFEKCFREIPEVGNTSLCSVANACTCAKAAWDCTKQCNCFSTQICQEASTQTCTIDCSKPTEGNSTILIIVLSSLGGFVVCICLCCLCGFAIFFWRRRRAGLRIGRQFDNVKTNSPQSQGAPPVYDGQQGYDPGYEPRYEQGYEQYQQQQPPQGQYTSPPSAGFPPPPMYEQPPPAGGTPGMGMGGGFRNPQPQAPVPYQPNYNQ